MGFARAAALSSERTAILREAAVSAQPRRHPIPGQFPGRGHYSTGTDRAAQLEGPGQKMKAHPQFASRLVIGVNLPYGQSSFGRRTGVSPRTGGPPWPPQPGAPKSFLRR
jgi:hypothetical protein